MVATFFVLDKDNKIKFFEKNFLLNNVKLGIVCEIPFVLINNIDINFQARNLQQRSYTNKKVLPTTIRVELIKKKEFTVATLDLDNKVFIGCIATLNIISVMS